MACQVEGAHGGTPIIVCMPVAESLGDKVASALPSLAVSLVALGISLYTLVYNRKKDDRQRLRSVDDEYWLRKVLSPHSIEPFLQFGTDLLQQLPPVEGGTEDEAAVFAQLTTRLRGLMTSFNALEVVDRQLALSVNQQVEKFEDRLVTYAYERKQFLASAAAEPSRSAVLEELAGIRTQVLTSIRQHQVSA